MADMTSPFRRSGRKFRCLRCWERRRRIRSAWCSKRLTISVRRKRSWPKKHSRGWTSTWDESISTRGGREERPRLARERFAGVAVGIYLAMFDGRVIFFEDVNQAAVCRHRKTHGVGERGGGEAI